MPWQISCPYLEGDVWLFKKIERPFGRPCKKDPGISGSILGPPDFWKAPYGQSMQETKVAVAWLGEVSTQQKSRYEALSEQATLQEAILVDSEGFLVQATNHARSTCMRFLS